MSVLNVSGWSYFRDLIAVLEKKIKDNGVNEKHPVLYIHIFTHRWGENRQKKIHFLSVYPHEFSMKLAHTLQSWTYTHVRTHTPTQRQAYYCMKYVLMNLKLWNHKFNYIRAFAHATTVFLFSLTVFPFLYRLMR